MDRDEGPAIEEDTLARRSGAHRFGKYRALGRIGQGGMAEVFLAAGRGPAGFNKLVVVKRLRENVASDDLFREMFLEEARLAARLNHPNVVQTYEVFDDGGAYFITMEYLEGQPLNRIVRECARRGVHLSPGVCARIVSDALCGLHYAHEIRDYDGSPLQIVHRDVSPQNIFVTYDGQVKVVDFGIAKAEGSQTKTQAGMFKGKTAYMAPEQLQGGEIDRRVDVFTSGILLWELLCERRLMASESAAHTMVKLLQEPIPRVSHIAGHVEAALCQIVARALERDPALRFPSAGEMRNALEEYLTQSGQVVRSEDVGAIMTDLFSEMRAERQRQIREQMAHPSEYPPSGSGLVSLPSMSFDRSLVSGLELGQPASVSGINVAHTVRSATSAPPAQPVAHAPVPRGGRMLATVGIAALCAAAGLVYLERARWGAPPASAPAVATALPVASAAPPASRPAPLPPEAPPSSSPAPSAAAEPAPAETPSSTHVAASPQATGRTVPPRWGHPTEAKPVSAAPRSSPAAAQANPVAAPSEPDARAATPPPPPAPSAPPTQEGRKFRTSL